MWRRSLGRQFEWLWGAFAVSAVGTWLAFDAFPLIAITVLHSGPAQVSLLAAAGLAVGAAVAVPLGPWMEFRRKRPVMIAMDLARFGAIMTVPAAYALGWLTFAQLLAVSVVVSAADLTFTAASGAFLKSLVPREDLLVANGRFESTNWTASMLGPPLGGAAIGIFGPVTTVTANAVSFLLSAIGVRAIGGHEAPPVRKSETSAGDDGGLLEGWRYLLTSPVLRPLLLNNVVVNGLIMASAPLLAVLMLGHLGFAPWQYALAFAVPCTGGLIGSRVSRPLVARFGQYRILVVFGSLRAVWPVGLAFVQPGVPGLAVVMLVEGGLIFCSGVFNPVSATYRLNHAPPGRVARVLSAWSVTSKTTIATMTGLWGVLASLTSARIAIGAAGVLLLATPLMIPRHDRAPEPERELAPARG
ncbi:MFS transporter [Actinomadura barringtoniae]|nr:MFS transporter [Actinomadura barringtoniae]